MKRNIINLSAIIGIGFLVLLLNACSKTGQATPQTPDQALVSTYIETRGGEGGVPTGQPGKNGCKNLDLSTLPQTIKDYVLANYPDTVTIIHAVLTKNGEYIIELSNHTLLLFDANGAFVKELPWLPGGPHNGNHHPHDSTGNGGHPHDSTGMGGSCHPQDSTHMGGGNHPPHPGVKIADLSTLSSVITAYVTTNYPTATLDAAFLLPNGNYELEMIDGKKHFDLVFDANGNFLFKKPK